MSWTQVAAIFIGDLFLLGLVIGSLLIEWFER